MSSNPSTRCLPFTWDEPTGCTMARGWVRLTRHPDTSPDRVAEYGHDMWADERRCVGFYLTYERENLPVFWSAHVRRLRPTLRTDWEVRLGTGCTATVEEAKEKIEAAVKAHLDAFRWGPNGDPISL